MGISLQTLSALYFRQKQKSLRPRGWPSRQRGSELPETPVSDSHLVTAGPHTGAVAPSILHPFGRSELKSSGLHSSLVRGSRLA